MTEELPLEVRLSFKRLGYRLLLDNSGFLQKLAAESNIQIPIEYLCEVDDTQALAALGTNCSAIFLEIIVFSVIAQEPEINDIFLRRIKNCFKKELDQV
jgi:hypothetical protein